MPLSPDKTRHRRQQSTLQSISCSSSKSRISATTRTVENEVNDFPLWESPTEYVQNLEEVEEYDKVDHVSILLAMGREDSSREVICNEEARGDNNDSNALVSSGEKSVWLKRREAAMGEGRFKEKQDNDFHVDQNGFPIS